ncbi:Os09g0440850 [Oryza sativa Japonica Group]|nr:hypothetical protein OsI_31528 [Oryza sativa Indica Group]BAT08291.1 Os09g0440850 [Oryza sativa Japonica Group]
MAVARLGAGAGAGGGAPRRRRTFFLWLLLLRSRRALARLREYYAEMMRRLVAEAAALEPAPAKSRGGAIGAAPARSAAVVPAAVARMVLRCNSHYYIR